VQFFEREAVFAIAFFEDIFDALAQCRFRGAEKAAP
jgi:hypothetical protein